MSEEDITLICSIINKYCDQLVDVQDHSESIE